MAYPFPFFGSGNASYFEWFEMWIWFAAPIPVKARARVLKSAPGPCKEDASWPLPNLLWASNGDQFIGMHIINAYPDVVDAKRKAAADGTAPAEEEDDDDDGDDSGSRFIFASAAQEQAFNQGIERWLIELHKTHPIAFVARGEDGEAGGTQLDAWHADSVAQAAKLVPLFEAEAAQRSEHARYPIALAVGYAKQAGTLPPLSPALTAWIEAEAAEPDDCEDDE